MIGKQYLLSGARHQEAPRTEANRGSSECHPFKKKILKNSRWWQCRKNCWGQLQIIEVWRSWRSEALLWHLFSMVNISLVKSKLLFWFVFSSLCLLFSFDPVSQFLARQGSYKTFRVVRLCHLLVLIRWDHIEKHSLIYQSCWPTPCATWRELNWSPVSSHRLRSTLFSKPSCQAAPWSACNFQVYVHHSALCL